MMPTYSEQQHIVNSHLSIGVVGAGLMGRLTALSLIRQGYQVTLIDKDAPSGHQSAGFAAAGLLTPLGESLHCQQNIVEMGMASLSLWPTILAGLQQPVYFQQSGTLVISHDQDKGDYWHFVRSIQQQYPRHQINLLNRDQLMDLEPELSHRFNQWTFLSEEGQIDNRGLLDALKNQLNLLNVAWLHHAKVIDIAASSDGCRVGFNDQTNQSVVIDFDLVIDCRGIGAKSSLVDLRAVRGEIFRLHAPDVQLHRPIRLMHPRYQLYIAPKPNKMFLVGATEIDSDDESPMTVRSAMELLSAAYSVHPGFAEAHIIEQNSHLRPAFSDNQPKIQINQRLIQVNGLYRHGFLIAPVVLIQVERAIKQCLQHDIDDEPSQYGTLLPITKCT